MSGGLTDNHTCQQLLGAQQPVLFLWMLLHVNPGPVALPRTRKTNHQQHLERGREGLKCIPSESNQKMFYLSTLAAWLW